MNIIPVKLNLVAEYDTSTENDKCLLCKNPMIFDCCSCETKNNNDICKKCIGVCEHAFHKHCIDKHLKTTSTCPKCRATFTFSDKDLEPHNWIKIYKTEQMIEKIKSRTSA